MATATPPFKRYCKALVLKDDPERMETYREIHRPENMWPEITQGMRDVGILDMEIYRYGNVAFMIMDTVIDFDHESAMRKLATKPRQVEWEAYVSQFQETNRSSPAAGKWQLLERIYEMEQKEEYEPTEGQIKRSR